MAETTQIPDGAEFWDVDGQAYAVYYTPDGNPPVPLVWEIPDNKREDVLVGAGQSISIDRNLSQGQFQQTGAINNGTVSDIVNRDNNPFDDFVADLEKEMQVRPWLRDPEVLATVSGAMLEGREVTRAELQTTNWWQSHNERERQWLVTQESDPETANQMLEDNQIRVRNLLVRNGLGSPSTQLVSAMANRYTTGAWSETKLQEQVRVATDPFAPGRLDPELEPLLSAEREGTRKGEQRVRDTVHKWLGSYFGDWEESDIKRWAGKFRNDPDALQDLEEELKAQKNALFPEYGEESTWSEITTPWKNFVRQQWGQTVQDDDRVLYRVTKMNDAEEAADYLRKKGVDRGVGQVVDQVVESANKAFGGNVRTVQ